MVLLYLCMGLSQRESVPMWLHAWFVCVYLYRCMWNDEPKNVYRPKLRKQFFSISRNVMSQMHAPDICECTIPYLFTRHMPLCAYNILQPQRYSLYEPDWVRPLKVPSLHVLAVAGLHATRGCVHWPVVYGSSSTGLRAAARRQAHGQLRRLRGAAPRIHGILGIYVLLSWYGHW